MKLFKRLLVAPAALGLLTPLAVNANQLDIDSISNYSDEELEVDSNSFKPYSSTNPLLSGGEGLVTDDFSSDTFSETTTASFGVDMLLGSVDGASSEATTFDYQMGIGLETSFTGEDSLSATIDIGNAGSVAGGSTGLNFDSTGDALKLDGLTYTFPVGKATVMVGDNTDISGVYTGACAYNALTDYLGNCGTGNSVGIGGQGATAAMSYAFDNGFSIAGGISSPDTEVMGKESNDSMGVEVAYSGENYGVSAAYSMIEATSQLTAIPNYQAENNYYGFNAYYTPDASGLPTISAGLEVEEEDKFHFDETKTGYFVGLSWSEIGPGTFDLGLGTAANYSDEDTEYYIYEASYAYPVNDGVTLTPGVYIREGATTDETGIVVKTSFSF